MPRNVCPTCGAEYDAAQQTCERDGTLLRPLSSPQPTPPKSSGTIGTLVGAALSIEEAEAIRARSVTPRDVPRPTQPKSVPAIADSRGARNFLPIIIGALVVIAGIALIALSMRR